MEKLAESTRMAFRLAKVGSWSFDPYTMQGCWSEEAAAIHGLPPGQAPSLKQYASLFENLSPETLEQHIKQAVENEQSFSFKQN